MERPAEYGRWWNDRQRDDDWYALIFGKRTKAHEQFMRWVERHGPFNSMLEVGCGRGEPYARSLRTSNYFGCDIAAPQIEACQQRFPDRSASFFVADAVRDDLGGPYDLVFSHAVVDHVYDIDAFLGRLARATRRWLYISAYNGWYAELPQHVYRWVPKLTCFKNELSPSAARRTLETTGCENISIEPLTLDNGDRETIIVAQRRNAE